MSINEHLSQKEIKLMEQLKKAKQERIAAKREKKEEKERLRKERHFKLQAEIIKRRVEKEKLKKQKRAQALVKKAEAEKKSIEKLKREVFVEFDVKSVVPMIEASMKKYGEIEFSRVTPIGIQYRYTTLSAAKKAQKHKQIMSKLPVFVIPAEIKHHAVYFEAPEEMGKLDNNVLSQVETAMGAYGKVVNIKKKGRCIVVFFDNKESANSLTSNEGGFVTIELGGFEVQLLAGVPPTQKKRRKAQQQAKIIANRLNLNKRTKSMKMIFLHSAAQ